MGWVDGLGCALVDKEGHGLPDGLPFGDEVTLGMVELVMSVMAMRLGNGDTSQHSGSGSGIC